MSVNYNKYKLEDFLADTDFVLWCLNPEKEIDDKWNDFAKKYPASGAEFYKAVTVMKNVRLNDFALSSEEKLSLFNSITDDYKAIRRKRSRRLRTRLAAVAAAAAVLLVPLLMFMPRNTNNVNTVLSGNDITLVTGKETTVIPSESAYLEYTAEGGVQVNGQVRQVVGSGRKRPKQTAEMNELVVPVGRRAFVILADGSKVWVNSGTTLKYPSAFDGEARNIYVDGEVYVDVTEDAERPFTVHGQDFATRALGTAFNVRSYGDGGQPGYVVLVEGSVEVTTGTEEKVVLEPSQMMSIKGGGWSVREVDVFHYISWKDGLLVFSGDALDRIFAQISRYYNVEIDYSQSVGAMTCSGKLVLFEDLQATLDVLTAILPLRYAMIGDHVTIYMN